MAISETGVWLTDDGEVVTEQPKGRATQLVSKGGEISKAAQQYAANHGVSIPTGEEKPDEDGKSDDKPKRSKKAATETAVTSDVVETATAE